MTEDKRSFPDVADGRPALDLAVELWAAGCDIETASFVARRLHDEGYRLVRASEHRPEGDQA